MRIVLVRLYALGDIVHTWPLAEALAGAGPSHHITWVVEESLKTLVEGHPAVDTVLTVATRRWRRRPLSADTRRTGSDARLLVAVSGPRTTRFRNRLGSVTCARSVLFCFDHVEEHLAGGRSVGILIPAGVHDQGARRDH